MSGRPNSNGDLNSLIPIAILFCIPTGITQLIAIFMLIRLGLQRNWFGRFGELIEALKAGREAAAANRAARQDPGWAQDPWAGNSAPQQPGRTQAAGQSQAAGRTASSGKKAQVKPLRTSSPGTGLIIGGGITSGIFSLGFTATFIDFVRYGGWDDFTGLMACAMFLAAGLIMLFSGIGKNKDRERYMTYLAYIGANREVDLARMAANLDVPVKQLCKDLRKMLSKGILPTGYVDLAEGKLFLTEMGYQPSKAEEKKQEPEPARSQPRTEEDEDAILKEIRQVNDFIPDEVMSEKIDRIEEITRRILAYQKKHPERESQLRSFLNYYLPTTLKILRAYAQLDAQGVEGENISAAKQRIEGMMDQVVYGFEKQLDKLFQEDAMDVAADVEVLENMLRKDGLSSGEGMTLEI